MKQVHNLPIGRNVNVFFSCLYRVINVKDNMNYPLESSNMLLMNVDGPLVGNCRQHFSTTIYINHLLFSLCQGIHDINNNKSINQERNFKTSFITTTENTWFCSFSEFIIFDKRLPFNDICNRCSSISWPSVKKGEKKYYSQ